MANDNNETKIVKAAPKKMESQKDEQPRVTVKAAVIPQRNTKKQQTRTASAVNDRPTQRPPMGKPVVNKDLEGRTRPPIGKPVVPKEIAERGMVKEAAPAPEGKPAEVKAEAKVETKAPAAEVNAPAETAAPAAEIKAEVTYLQF